MGKFVTVGYAEVWHEPDRRRHGLGNGEAQALCLCFGRGELGLEARAAQTLRDGFEHVPKLSLRHIEFLLELGPDLALLARKLVPFVRKGLREGFGQGRLHHALGEHRQDLMFEGLPSDRPAVIAQSARNIVAGVAAPGIRRERASTGATDDLAREEVAGTTLLPKAGRAGLSVLGRGSIGKALLDLVPELLLDQT